MIVDLFYNDIGKDLRTVNTATVSKDQRQSHTKDRTSKGYCNKMLCIQLKRDFFKVGKTYCVDNKAHERFYKEILTDKNDPSYEKRQKHKQHT